MNSPYEILGLHKECSDRDITKAYRNLSKIHHPDVGGNPEVFAQISLAVEVLRDPTRRKLFDERGIFMTDSSSMLNSNAISKFNELVSQWILASLQQEQDINISNFLNQNIQHARNNIQEADKNINNMISKLERRLKQVTVKGERNIVGEQIASKLNEFNNAKIANARESIVLGIIAEECAKYSSIEDAIQNRVMFGNFGNTTTSTGYVNFNSF